MWKINDTINAHLYQLTSRKEEVNKNKIKIIR